MRAPRVSSESSTPESPGQVEKDKCSSCQQRGSEGQIVRRGTARAARWQLAAANSYQVRARAGKLVAAHARVVPDIDTHSQARSNIP